VNKNIYVEVFKTNLSITYKIFTLTIFLLLSLIIFLLWSWHTSINVKFFLSFLILTLFLSPYLFYPKKIILNEEGIRIVRTLKDIKINYSNILEVRKLKSRIINIIGSDGIFGHIGLYYIRGHGKVFSYLTDDKKAYIVTLKSKKRYLLSLDEKLIKRLEVFLRNE